MRENDLGYHDAVFSAEHALSLLYMMCDVEPWSDGCKSAASMEYTHRPALNQI
jgi:hypothetical protein